MHLRNVSLRRLRLRLPDIWRVHIVSPEKLGADENRMLYVR